MPIPALPPMCQENAPPSLDPGGRGHQAVRQPPGPVLTFRSPRATLKMTLIPCKERGVSTKACSLRGTRPSIIEVGPAGEPGAGHMDPHSSQGSSCRAMGPGGLPLLLQARSRHARPGGGSRKGCPGWQCSCSRLPTWRLVPPPPGPPAPFLPCRVLDATQSLGSTRGDAPPPHQQLTGHA